MSTNNEIINKALQELAIVASGEAATAQDAADTLDILNSMMAEWEELDVNFNWFTQDTLSATSPIPKWAESGVISNLAVYAAPQLRAPLNDAIAIKADRGFKAISTVLINQKIQGIDLYHVPLGYAHDASILTDA